VLGLIDGLEEVVPAYDLPRMVDAVLLPFKGWIIYDGLLQGYNISFGGGIRSDLNHTYMTAKQKDRIITTMAKCAETTPDDLDVLFTRECEVRKAMTRLSKMLEIELED
jgi:hypothetical protein